MSKTLKQRVPVEDGIHIEWAAPGKRMRKVVTQSGRQPTGEYPSWKMNRVLQWESYIERDAFRLHDVDPYVKVFQEQPVRLTYFINGIQQTHYPDMYVEAGGMRILREIKTEKDARRPEVKARTRYLSSMLPSFGYVYHVLTDVEIRKQPRFKNSKYLLRYGRVAVALLEQEAIRRYLVRHGYVLWGDIRKNCFGEYSVCKACRLILEGMLQIDMDKPINDGTCVSIRDKE